MYMQDYWREISTLKKSKRDAIYEAYELVKDERWFGYNLFWVENYKKNKESFLKKNMWLGVSYD